MLIPGLQNSVFQVTIQRWWQSVYRTTTEEVGTQTFAVEVTTGITNTSEQMESFGTTIGAGAGAELSGISSTLNTELSQATSYTEGVSLAQQTTTTSTYEVDATQDQVSIDLWQLYEQYTVQATLAQGSLAQVTLSPNTLTNALPQFHPLTYPANVTVTQTS